MAEQQLQMEPIQKLDGNGGVVEDTTMNLDDIPAMEEDYAVSGINPTAATQPDVGLRPSRPQLEGAAGLINIAALETAVTPDSVEETLLSMRPSSQVQGLLLGLAGEDEEIRQAASLSVISNPRVSVLDKIQTIAMMQDDVTGGDVNSVQRQVGHNMAHYDWMRDDEEDSGEWYEQASINAEAISRNIEAFDPANGPAEEQRQDVWAELDAMYRRSNEDIGVLDFVEQVTPAGSLPTLNATVARIYNDLGLKGNFEKGLSYTAVGEALADLRNTYHYASADQKEQIAKTVMAALKENTGLFQDSNDLVITQVMENLFSKELTGREFRDGAEFEKTPAEQEDLRRQINELQGQINAKRKSGDVSGLGQLYSQQDALQESLAQMPGPGRFADNTFNLLDLVGLGQAGRSTIAMGRKFVPRMWQRLFSASPKAGADRMADAVTTPGIAEQMGIDPKLAIEQGLPNAGGKIERGVNVLATLAARQQETIETALRQSMPVNMTLSERAAALSELQDELGVLVEKRLPRAHINATSVMERADGSGADIEAIFGATTNRGYARLDYAQNAAKRMVEDVLGADAPYDIVQWNARSGAYEVVGKAPSKTKGEFFIRAQDSRSYASTRKTYGALNIGDDAVADLTLGASVSRWTRALNIFDTELQGWISTRARTAASSEGIGAGLMKPIASMSSDKKQWLSKIIKDNEGKRVLNDADLRAAGADDEMVAAYDSFRRIDDGIYDLVDQNLRNQYMREGLQDVHVNGVRAGWAKPVKSLNRDTLIGAKVFDPESGAMIKMTQDDVVKLYDNGGMAGRLKFPMETPNGRATHMLLSGKTTRVLPIPQRGILPRITGHYPHITQGNYVVYGVTKEGERVALKMAATATDAAGYVARRGAISAGRVAKGKTSRFASMHYELDKSLQNPEAWGQKLDEVFTNNGGVLFGQRSDAVLGNLSKDFGAINVDPIQSLLTGWNVATQSVTKGELVASMKQRLHNFLRSPANRNLFVDPETPAQYLGVKNINTAFTNVKARDTALAYAKQIELMEHSPDAWRSATREAYRRMSYTAFQLGQKPIIQKTGLGVPLRKLEKALLDKSRHGANAVNSAMSYMHAVYIAMAAPKQFVLQAMQSLYAAGLSPTGYAKAVQQFTAVAGGVMGRMQTLHGGAAVLSQAELHNLAQQTSKFFGMKPKEMTDLIDTVVESGLLDAVQHNTMIKEAVADAAKKQLLSSASGAEQTAGAISRVVNTAGNVASWPVRQLSKIGFQGGENINQIMTFLTVYNADKAKGIADLASHAYRDQLVGRVAELTGNMISEAAPDYTRSFLKPFFQWVQFQHKMVLMTLPKSLGGSSMFSGAEKARMAAVQTLLYGTQATAITATVHQVIELKLIEKLQGEDPNNEMVQFWRSEPAKAAFDGFLFDYTANKALQAIYGESDKEWREFSWGKAFAPGAGSEFLSERIIGLVTLDKEAMFGVLGQQTSKLAQFANRASDVAQGQWKGLDDVPFEQRAEQLTRQGLASSIPMYDKYLSMRWAQEHDERISAGGRVSEGFSNDLEVVLNFTLGVNPKETESYYAAMDRLGAKAASGNDDPVQRIADTYWKNLVGESTKWASQAPDESLYDTLLSNWTAEQALVLSALNRRDKARINEIIGVKLEAIASGEAKDADAAETAFVQKFATKLAAGGYGADGPSLAAYMSETEFVKNNPERAVLVQQAWEEILEEPSPDNLTTNEIGN